MVKTNTVVPYQTTSEANNNEVRPSRPRTKTTVIRTHENVQCGSTQLMSSANQNNPNHPKKSSTTTTQNPISMPKLIENSSHNSHSSNSNSSICKSSSSNSHNTNSNSTATVSNRVYSKAALASKTNGVQATNSSNSSSSTSGVGSQSHAMNTHSMVL